ASQGLELPRKALLAVIKEQASGKVSICIREVGTGPHFDVILGA
ncbi:unnamed protein product, partial [Linum tenue]